MITKKIVPKTGGGANLGQHCSVGGPFNLSDDDGDMLQGTVMSGLIADIVHIQPTWATERDEIIFHNTNMAIGWFKPEQTGFHSKTMELCMCEVS